MKYNNKLQNRYTIASFNCSNNGKLLYVRQDIIGGEGVTLC